MAPVAKETIYFGWVMVALPAKLAVQNKGGYLSNRVLYGHTYTLIHTLKRERSSKTEFQQENKSLERRLLSNLQSFEESVDGRGIGTGLS